MAHQGSETVRYEQPLAAPDINATALAIAYCESAADANAIAKSYILALARAYGVPVAFSDAELLSESITVPHEPA